VTWAVVAASRITTGRRNIIRFTFSRFRLSLLKSAPRTGMSPASGTLSMLSL
jgi:hypothetical protein